jgi:hypothetical protein
MPDAVNVEAPAALSTMPLIRSEVNRADRQFSIKRAKSDAGYVYWILEGYGQHKCFVLCDTWEEAMEQAKNRLDSEKDDYQDFMYADGL